MNSSVHIYMFVLFFCFPLAIYQSCLGVKKALLPRLKHCKNAVCLQDSVTIGIEMDRPVTFHLGGSGLCNPFFSPIYCSGI